MTDIFSPDTYSTVRLPIAQASPLPGWCYASPEWHERELKTIFQGPNSDWLCVGRVEQVPSAGDYFTFDLFGQPLIVVRDTANNVNVLSAVCRHRGAIVAEGQGKRRAFVCPYHSWTYGLNGALLNLPGTPSPLEGVQDFNKSDHGLTPIKSDVWAGFIFITFATNPPPLLEKLGQLPDFVKNYNLEDMQFVHRKIIEDVDCNWKVWLENGLENYHVATVHRKYFDPSNPQNWAIVDTDGSFEALYSSRSIGVYSEAGLPKLDKLDSVQSSSLYHVWVPPNLHLVMTPFYIRYKQHIPVGPDRFTLIEDWAFPKSTLELPEFAKALEPESGYYDKHADIINEDLATVPSVQRGMSSGAFQPGRYVIEEHIVHRIANYVVERATQPLG